ncbi:MAG TPA: MFS transporter [Candidatus Saccharimonadales bacterium]|nr:MFS transporter [Candidatus Saccharimonadales bacterium]
MKYYLKVGIEHFAFGLILPVSIIWKLHNGLSLLQAADTEALVLIVTAIVNLPAGVFADRFGNKKSLLVGGALHAIAMALLAYGGSLLVFTLAAILSGAAWAFITGADEAYIHDDYIKDKKHYQHTYANASIVDEATTVGGMLASSLVLLTHANLRILFIVAGACLFANVLYTSMYLPNRHQGASYKPTRLSFAGFKAGLLDSRKLLPLFLVFAILYESGRVLWQPQMASIGIDVTNFGLAFAFFKLLSIGGTYLARKQTFSVKKLVTVFVLMSASLALFGLHSLVVSIAALSVFLATENYFRIYMSATLNKAIQRNRATLLSVSGVATNLAGSGLIVVAGFFGEKSILIALLVLVACKIPAIVYVLWTHRAMIKANDVQPMPIGVNEV